MSNSASKIFAWHYAIALALLQQSSKLVHTIGKKDATIDQAQKHFSLERSVAINIYDSIKNMKHPGNESEWDINYFLENIVTKKRKNYKEIITKLLGEYTPAIILLNNLID